MERPSEDMDDEEQDDEMDVAVDDAPENESGEAEPDEDEGQLASGPVVAHEEENQTDGDSGEEEGAGQASAHPHQAPVVASKKFVRLGYLCKVCCTKHVLLQE